MSLGFAKITSYDSRMPKKTVNGAWKIAGHEPYATEKIGEITKGPSEYNNKTFRPRRYLKVSIFKKHHEKHAAIFVLGARIEKSRRCAKNAKKNICPDHTFTICENCK